MFKRTIAAVMILAAMMCFTVKADAAKSDKWIVYWYVCGTNIETTNIAFKPGTDLTSDDPNAIILADPDRNPGDVTRCIKEVEKAELSPNVKIFMQAGGTYVWGHPKFRELNAKILTGLGKGNSLGNGNGFYSEWHLKDPLEPKTMISRGSLGRYVYDKYHRNWHAYEILPISGEKNTNTDMGSKEGLISFLRAGQEVERKLYPDGNVRRILILKDHGGGSLSGACEDQYTRNIIRLKQMQDAFKEVSDGWTNPEEKPFEVIAFDACIMSTYETAVALEESANYMVASQESTFNKVGLNYTGLLNDLSKNPSMSGKTLGKVICDTYWTDSKQVDKEFNMNANVAVTMSVTDLSAAKMDALKTAYTDFSQKTLSVARKNPEEFVQTFIKIKNSANAAEKFSVIARDSNAVDLKNFAENMRANFEEIKPAGDALVTAINNSVVYQKRGDAFKLGGGLSTYYPFDLLNAEKSIQAFKDLAADNLTPTAQGQLYEFLNENVMANVTPNIVPVINPKTKQPVRDPKTGEPLVQQQGWLIPKDSLFDLSKLANEIVYVDEDKKSARLEVSPESLQGLESVRCQLVYVRGVTDPDGTERLQGSLLGADSSMSADWKAGVFQSTFRGKWLMFEGHPVYAQVVSDGTKKDKKGKKVGGTEIYSIPILINGQARNMFVSCKYPGEKYTIVGATSESDGSGLPSGDLYGFKKGDVVNLLYFDFDISEDDLSLEDQAQAKFGKDYESLTEEQKLELVGKFLSLVPGSPITIGSEKPKVGTGKLPDGKYLYIFEFVNPVGGQNVRTEEGAVFTVKDGSVTEAKHVDDIEKISDLQE